MLDKEKNPVDKISSDLIIRKLDKLDDEIEGIKESINLIAVQSNQIDNLSSQVHALWKKYDNAFSPEGSVTQIMNFQAACPKETIIRRLKELWLAYALLASILVGLLLKK